MSSPPPVSAWRFCIAPMMQYTDRHFRFQARLLTRHARLYTEMVVASALLRGDAARFLAHAFAESPVALQLGGCDPESLAAAARLGERAGFCEVNLNVGCPSDRVQSGSFGACLMRKPGLVADCVAAMRDAVTVPVTVKTRLGVDDHDSQNLLLDFVGRLADAGCEALMLHARKALLNFSPRANREIPPLDYPRVYAVKAAFPRLPVILNGGIAAIAAAAGHLERVDGVMLGRAAYARADLLRAVDAALYGDYSEEPPDGPSLLRRLEPYLVTELAAGTPLRLITRHWFALHEGKPGAREWRRLLGTHSVRPRLDAATAVAEAIACLDEVTNRTGRAA
jgi:tRNA-dihydrouridine synthase A